MPELPLLKRLHTPLLSDFHCHCDYSIDAGGTVDEYCRVALERGLAELCFTTHYDSNPRGDQSGNLIRVKNNLIPATPDNLQPYVDEVGLATEKYQPLGLTVKLGVEYGWYNGCEASAAKLLERFEFDYVLCGIHIIDDLCFCSRHTYKSCFDTLDLNSMIEKYFAQVTAAAKSELFDTIAHLDYYKKYGLDYYGPKLLEAHRSIISESFEALKAHATCLEVNTAGMRIGLESYYPSTSIVNEARRAGVMIRYLGSDAHKPEQVGFDFDMAAPLVEAPVSDLEG